MMNPYVAYSPTQAQASAVIARPGLVIMAILAAGLDFRLKDMGLKGPNSNALELTVLISSLVLLADTTINPRQPSQLLGTAWRANRWLLLYFAWAFVAALIGLLNLGPSLFIWRNILPALVLFVLASAALDSHKRILGAMFWFILASLPNTLLAISQRLFNKPFPVKLNVASALKMDVDGRLISAAVSGLFNHPNALSVFLIPAVLLAFGLTVKRTGLHPAARFVSAAILLLGLAALGFTHAKGAWAWTAFGVGLMLLPARWLKFKHAWLALATLTVAAVVALTGISLYIGGSLQTMLTRVLLWKSAAHALWADPFAFIFGSAQDAVWYASARLADLQYANAHNTYLNQMVNFGLPALVLYLAGLVAAIRAGGQALRSATSPELANLSQMVLVTMLAIAGENFFEPASDASSPVTTVCLFMAILYALRKAGVTYER